MALIQKIFICLWSTHQNHIFLFADLLRPELHYALLVAGCLRGLDAAAVKLGVKVVAPLLEHVDVDIGHGQEHAHNRVPDVHTITRVGLGAYLIKLLVKVLKTVPLCPWILKRKGCHNVTSWIKLFTIVDSVSFFFPLQARSPSSGNLRMGTLKQKS